MIEIIAIFAPIVVSVALIVVFILILMAAVNDMILMGRHTQASRPRRSTTVIVLADDPSSLKRCLQSIGRARLGQHDIVVVDRYSTNDHRGIRSIVTAKKNAVVYRPRVHHDDEQLLKLAYSRSRKAATVMIIHDSVCIAPNVDGRTTFIWNLALQSRSVRLRPMASVEGFAGVVTAIRSSAVSLINGSLGALIKPRSLSIEGGCYIVSADKIKKSTVLRDGWRYDTRAPRIMVEGVPVLEELKGKNIGLWLTAGLFAAFGYVLVVASTAHNQTEPLILVWTMIAIGSVAIVLFDPFQRATQKYASIACVGFMPLLALLSIVVKIRRA